MLIFYKTKNPGCSQHPGWLRVLPILSHKKMIPTSNFLCAHFNMKWRKLKWHKRK